MSPSAWYYVKLLGFSAFPAIPLLALIGYYAHLPWLSPVLVFAAIPLLDLLIGPDRTRPLQRPAPRVAHAWLYLVPHLYVVTWLAALLWAAVALADDAASFGARVSVVIAVALASAFATCAGHELLHRPSKMDRFMSRLAMATVAYGQFVTEHLHRHATVGIVRAGTTPTLGQSVWSFVLRNAAFFSCKTRYFCPSCHQKRVLLYGEWVEENVLASVPHRQYVFTLPRLVRHSFARRREWLGELCRIAARLLSQAYAEVLPGGKPGLILFVQTFGDLVNFNPHLHVLAADGAFLPDGRFVALPPVPGALLAEGFRRAVLKFLVKNETLSEELRSRMLTCRHSGFSAHNEVRVAAEDAKGRKKLAGYMLRAPMSLEKMSYDAATGTVIYRSKMHAGLKRNFQVMPGAEWLWSFFAGTSPIATSIWCATWGGIRTGHGASGQ